MSVDRLKELLAAETEARDNLINSRNEDKALEAVVKATHDAVEAWIAQEKEKTDLQRALDQMTRERDHARREVADLDNRLTALALLSEELEQKVTDLTRRLGVRIEEQVASTRAAQMAFRESYEQKAKDWEANATNLGIALAGTITEKNDLQQKLVVVGRRLQEYCERLVDDHGELVTHNEHVTELRNATLERAAQVADDAGAHKIVERIRALKVT